MSASCSKVPVLGDPPQIVAGGQYVVVVDENGDTRILQRKTNAILGQWGDNVYFADGSDNSQVILDNIQVDDQDTTQQEFGLLGLRTSGRMVCIANSSGTEKIPVLVGNTLTLQNKADSAIPSTGSGFVIRNPSSPTSFAESQGLYFVNGAGIVTRILPGDEGDFLKWINGVPVFDSTTTQALTGSMGVSGIDDAYCYTSADDKVTLTVPLIVVTDGADDKIVGPVSKVIDIDSGVALLGTDATLVPDKWYYLYVITDDAGTTVSAVASQDGSAPDLSASAFSTLPYTRYGKVGICFYDSTAVRIIKFIQKGRRIVTERQKILANVTNGVTTNWSYIDVAKQNIRLLTFSVPPIAKTMSGIIGGSSTSTTTNGLALIVSSYFDGSDALGEQYIAKSPADIAGDEFKYDAGSFQDLPIKDPSAGTAMIAWKAKAADSHRVFVVNGYTI